MDKSKISQKQVMTFIQQISKLEPIEFFGLVNLFSISLDKEDKTPKDFYELLNEVVERYFNKDRKFRRKVDKILKAATSKEKKK